MLTDFIGVRGNALLLMARGETEVPDAAIVRDKIDAMIFMEHCVTGDRNAEFEGYMSDLQSHDFSDGEDWKVEFEMGGISATVVFVPKEPPC